MFPKLRHLTACVLSCLAFPAFADEGVNSVPGTDLPVGAGGTTAFIVGAGVAVPSKDVAFLGNITTAGVIKLGTTSNDCTSTYEGAMRYNATLKVIQYCNGSTWTSMSGGTGSFGGHVHMRRFFRNNAGRLHAELQQLRGSQL
jgi:hypothetical protein